MHQVARRSLGAGIIALVALFASACVPHGVTLTPSGGNTTCPAGSWHLDSTTVFSTIQSALGGITITPSGTGVDLTLNSGSPNTWNLSVDQTVTVASTNVNGTATVTGSASGTYTTSGDQITFTLGNLSGTVAVSGTAFGHTGSFTWALPQSGGIAKLYGMSGSATYACNSNGTLSLTFPTFRHHFHH
jgi:hypothetical protein